MTAITRISLATFFAGLLAVSGCGPSADAWRADRGGLNQPCRYYDINPQTVVFGDDAPEVCDDGLACDYTRNLCVPVLSDGDADADQPEGELELEQELDQESEVGE